MTGYTSCGYRPEQMTERREAHRKTSKLFEMAERGDMTPVLANLCGHNACAFAYEAGITGERPLAYLRAMEILHNTCPTPEMVGGVYVKITTNGNLIRHGWTPEEAAMARAV